MAEIPKIVLPHGGYRKLIVYRKSDVIYQGTVAFCRRFLPAHGDRTVDQMTQAARSCKQNIAEGSAAAATPHRAGEGRGIPLRRSAVSCNLLPRRV